MIARKIRPLAAVFALVLFGATPSFAASAFDYLVEPYLGYGLFGVSSVGVGTYTTGNTAYANYSGFNLGTRAGIQIMDLVFIALDASYAPSLSVQSNAVGRAFNVLSNSPLMNTGASNTRLGLVAGVSVPLIGVRLWLGYNFLDQLSGTSATSLNGYSVKVGASLSFLVFFNLNAELLGSTYSTFSPGGGTSITNPSGAIGNSHLLISVSAPFTF